jgi:Protein of unknown function (DUF3455)
MKIQRFELGEDSMKRLCILSLSLVVLPACSGDNSTPGNNNATDASLTDTSTPEDTGAGQDAGSPLDTGSSPPDTGTPPGDGGIADADADADAASEHDASEAGCPSSWFVAPVVDTSITLPDGGAGVLLHAVGTGTQNYVCAAATVDGGSPAWTLVTPEANLTDCHDTLIGHHFASEAGAAFPEWQTTDGTYVIGSKHLPTFTPDGGAGSIPWLLLKAVDAGGSGTLSMTQYIQRLNTDGGNAPADGCNVGTVGNTRDVPYTADYYFYGP